MSKFRGYFAWNNLIVYAVFAWIATIVIRADQVSEFAYLVFFWCAGLGALVAVGVIARFLADRLVGWISKQPRYEVKENDWGYICFLVASFWAVGFLLAELVLFFERSGALSVPGTISSGGWSTVIAIPCLYAIGIALKLPRKKLVDTSSDQGPAK